MELQRYAIELTYHGRAYYGWQRQPRQPSVQQTIESAMSDILGTTVSITGCGRTDTGVHAHRYWAHADVEAQLSQAFLYRLNKYLPDDIGILNIVPVAADWHARFDAVSRTYRYYIHYSKDPFLSDRSFWLRHHRPDITIMQEAASMLEQFDDFRLFEKKGSDTNNSKCILSEAIWKEGEAEGVFYFEITANRFLRNMVRRITAALIEIGIGRLSLQDLRKAMDGQVDVKISMAVPAHGLHLWEVKYPEQ